MKEFRRKSQRGWVQLAAAAIGAIASWYGQKKTNEANAKQAEAQRQWTSEQSNTSYQRGVRDMKEAGLNPMLAYSQGGASTPTSAAPVMGNELGEGVKGGMSSAVQAMQVLQGAQGIDQSVAQTDQLNAQTEKTRSETLSRDLNTAKFMADMDLTKMHTKLGAIDALKREEDVVSAREGAKQSQLQTEWMRNTREAREKGEKARNTKDQYQLEGERAMERKWRAINKLGDVAEPHLQGVLDNAKGGTGSAWQKFQDWRDSNARRNAR